MPTNRLDARDVRSINSNWVSTKREVRTHHRWFISNHYHPMSVRPSSVHAHRAPSSSVRTPKLQELYVLVPRSPYSLGISERIGPRTADEPHNPPTPLRAYNMPSAASPLSVIKRKRSTGNFDETEQRAPEAKSKTQKFSTTASKAPTATRPTPTVASNATADFPNGFFYCHQCNKKRDSSGERALS